MEFTEEQQKHIDELVAKATQGLFTEEELERRVTSEVDRRVESGIQKGISTQRVKWEEEYEKKAKLTAEEIARMELQEQKDKLVEREVEINKRSNTIDARDTLSEAGIPKDDYTKFLDLLVSDDPEATQERVNDFVDTFTTTKKNIESTIRKELANVPPPKGDMEGDSGTGAKDFISIAQEANIRR